MTRRLLTPRQQEVLGYITDYVEANKYPPTMKEIGEYLGVAKSTAFLCVQVLHTKGYIEVGGGPRTLRVVEP